MEEEKKKRGRKKKEQPAKEIEKVEAELVEPKKGFGVNGNLIADAHKLTVEEQRKGGYASVEARRKKKELREFTRDFLMQEASGVLKKNMEALGVVEDDMSNLAAMVVRLFTKATNQGDLNAARTVIEWAGMAPLQQERENEAIAKMSQVMQLASGNNDEEGDVEDVVFYIPDNGRNVSSGDDVVAVSEGKK